MFGLTFTEPFHDLASWPASSHLYPQYWGHRFTTRLLPACPLWRARSGVSLLPDCSVPACPWPVPDPWKPDLLPVPESYFQGQVAFFWFSSLIKTGLRWDCVLLGSLSNFKIHLISKDNNEEHLLPELSLILSYISVTEVDFYHHNQICKESGDSKEF